MMIPRSRKGRAQMNVYCDEYERSEIGKRTGRPQSPGTLNFLRPKST